MSDGRCELGHDLNTNECFEYEYAGTVWAPPLASELLAPRDEHGEVEGEGW